MSKMAAKIFEKPGRYSIMIDNNLNLQDVTYKGTNVSSGTYTIVVDNNSDTQSVTNPKYPDPMKRAQGYGLDPALHHPRAPSKMSGLPSGLRPGCVGLAMLVPGKDDECIWKFDSWW